jgi:hypothetical protein
MLIFETTYAIERVVAIGQAVRTDYDADSFIEIHTQWPVNVRLPKSHEAVTRTSILK